MSAVDELVETAKKIIGSEWFGVSGIHDVNWKVDGQPGHPFTIGVKHVTYAADHCGGMLGQEVIDKIPCAAKASAHTHDKVLFLVLKKNVPQATAKEIRGSAPVLYFMSSNKIDGFAFVETGGKFRITK